MASIIPITESITTPVSQQITDLKNLIAVVEAAQLDHDALYCDARQRFHYPPATQTNEDITNLRAAIFDRITLAVKLYRLKKEYMTLVAKEDEIVAARQEQDRQAQRMRDFVNAQSIPTPK